MAASTSARIRSAASAQRQRDSADAGAALRVFLALRALSLVGRGASSSSPGPVALEDQVRVASNNTAPPRESRCPIAVRTTDGQAHHDRRAARS